MNKTRKEHLEWCKKRALGYMDDEPSSAMASFVSDMSKHKETANQLDMFRFLMLSLHKKEDIKRFIEGFD